MKTDQYNRYKTHIFDRKTGKKLYTLDGESVLTEKEAINMQINLSTYKKVYLLEIIL